MENLIQLYFILTYFFIAFILGFMSFLLVQLISYRILKFNLYKFIIKKIDKIMEV